ncbi:MAG: FAD:protein FMN transferase, partial [Gammaproteobacteria bacterium]
MRCPHRPGRVAMMAGVLALTLLAACARSPEPMRFEGPTMGTRYHITVVGVPPGIAEAELQSDIDGSLARVDAAMSTWRPDSEISRLNGLPVGEWLQISPEFHEVLKESFAI